MRFFSSFPSSFRSLPSYSSSYLLLLLLFLLLLLYRLVLILLVLVLLFLFLARIDGLEAVAVKVQHMAEGLDMQGKLLLSLSRRWIDCKLSKCPVDAETWQYSVESVRWIRRGAGGQVGDRSKYWIEFDVRLATSENREP